MSDFSDPCPPPVFPPNVPLVLPTSYTTEACVPYNTYAGWMLNENLVDYVLQEDGASLIAI